LSLTSVFYGGIHGINKPSLSGFKCMMLLVQVLTNGDEVKLQRNALSVIEAPSGHEEHDDNEENPFSSGTSLG